MFFATSFLWSLAYVFGLLPRHARVTGLHFNWDGTAHYVDIYNALQFEDTVRDTPLEVRPHSFVTFYDETCEDVVADLGVVNTAATYPRTHLLTGLYDFGRDEKRGWFEWYDDMDLHARFALNETDLCPALTIIPNKYDREHRDVMPLVWDGDGDWQEWLRGSLYDDLPETFFNDETWSNHRLRERDYTEARTHLMVAVMPPNVPHFTELGWKVVKMPDELIAALKKFHEKYKHKRIKEQWHDLSTQINFHEVETHLVYLDNDPHERNRIAEQYIKPLLEKWCNCKLFLKAFYGIREYSRGAELRQHIDRIDTHVISAAIHMWADNEEEKWPFEVIDFTGKRQVLELEAWEMVYYESAVLPHGRMQTMKADKYVNCFCHFSPHNWPYHLRLGHVLEGPMGKIVMGDKNGILNRQHHMKVETKLKDPNFTPWKVGDGINAQRYQLVDSRLKRDAEEEHPSHEL